MCGEKEGNEGGDLCVLVYLCEIHAYTMSKGGDHILYMIFRQKERSEKFNAQILVPLCVCMKYMCRCIKYKKAKNLNQRHPHPHTSRILLNRSSSLSLSLSLSTQYFAALTARMPPPLAGLLKGVFLLPPCIPLILVNSRLACFSSLGLREGDP